ncbi:ribonucleoside-diphosphate reductase subunit alpha, partial [Listeria monocytogenes]|nr:ribonucleoside-diphosphate reductase subunit alpha [Listeria monocytogenes]
YSSNLCTEIMQNMSPTKMIQEIISGDQIVITKQAGDFVVCNLSSVNLGRAVVAEEGTLERLIEVEVRMLDNVIDLNELPVPQATITNQKYRSIGLGTFGWH